MKMNKNDPIDSLFLSCLGTKDKSVLSSDYSLEFVRNMDDDNISDWGGGPTAM